MAASPARTHANSTGYLSGQADRRSSFISGTLRWRVQTQHGARHSSDTATDVGAIKWPGRGIKGLCRFTRVCGGRGFAHRTSSLICLGMPVPVARALAVLLASSPFPPVHPSASAATQLRSLVTPALQDSARRALIITGLQLSCPHIHKRGCANLLHLTLSSAPKSQYHPESQYPVTGAAG